MRSQNEPVSVDHQAMTNTKLTPEMQRFRGLIIDRMVPFTSTRWDFKLEPFGTLTSAGWRGLKLTVADTGNPSNVHTLTVNSEIDAMETSPLETSQVRMDGQVFCTMFHGPGAFLIDMDKLLTWFLVEYLRNPFRQN